jgi:hypothetical protein
MTGASKGLQTALARTGASVLAIAEMQTSDILANLTDEQKAELGASLAPSPAPAADASEAQPEPAKSTADAAPASDAHARVKAVFAAAEMKGREAVALAILADDEFAGLSAAAVVKMAAMTPLASGEDADGKAILAAITASANANLGAGGEAEPRAEANHGWDAIHAELRERRG